MRVASWALAAAGVLTFPPVHACGICDEDKVAGTYDHAVVHHANLQRRIMVFCEVHGSLDSRRLKAAVHRIRGVDPASLRTSANPATLSFALDSRRQSPQSAVDALQALALPGSQLTIVRLQGGSVAPLR